MRVLQIVCATCTLLGIAGRTWAACEDVDNYLNIPATLDGDLTIDISVDTIACATQEVIEVSGGVLTLTGTESTRFGNLRINVRSGAGLIFDFPTTKIGLEDNVIDRETATQLFHFLDVEEDASVIFTGDTVVNRVIENNYVFFNSGTMEFKGDAVFKNMEASVFFNSGELRFRGDTLFKNNWWSALRNSGGTVRFAGSAIFRHNGFLFYYVGNALVNGDDGIVIFDDTALFEENEGYTYGAVGNFGSKLKFYGKAYFYSNLNKDGNGGAITSTSGGEIKFKGATQFKDNIARYGNGGAISLEGGYLTFDKSVVMSTNTAEFDGTLSVVSSFSDDIETVATVEFKKPDKVRIFDNTVEETGSCVGLSASVESVIIGYTGIDGELCGEWSS